MKPIPARRGPFTLAAVLAFASVLGAAPASAQTYPIRAITVILPFAGGSASDVVARILYEHMSRTLGQSIIVDNRPGAGGNTGTAAAAKTAPDGYTYVATGVGALGVNKVLTSGLSYDPEKEFEPVALAGAFPVVVTASNKLPVKTLAELVAYAKTRPGELNYGSVGVGSSQHLAGVYFEQLAGVKLTHVAYRNIAQYMPDMMAGTVPLGFSWLPNVAAALQANGATPLAVAAKTRLPALPNVPTTAEAGLPQYVVSGWLAMMAPRGTPRPSIDRINKALAEAAQDPTVVTRIRQHGATAPTPSPDELGRFVKDEVAQWIDLIKKVGLQPQ
jgi:tripartite-type tricarboxylate transporter receptor subunit TctC